MNKKGMTRFQSDPGDRLIQKGLNSSFVAFFPNGYRNCLICSYWIMRERYELIDTIFWFSRSALHFVFFLSVFISDVDLDEHDFNMDHDIPAFDAQLPDLPDLPEGKNLFC